MNDTNIGWATKSWNPVTGCSKVSAGCRECYAETMSLRRGWSRKPWTARNAAENVVLHPDRLRQPLSLRKPGERIFVNSMSDLFHELVPWDFIDAVMDVAASCPQHVFLVLTKRPERIREYLAWQHTGNRSSRRDGIPVNVWLGTSIEDRRVLDRADYIRALPCAVRFISAEPLIGPLVQSEDLDDEDYVAFDEQLCFECDIELYMGHDPECSRTHGPGLDLTGIDQVIVGGESGTRPRPIRVEWVRAIRDLCVQEGVAFYFKQWGGRTWNARGRLLDGRSWEEFPAAVEPQQTLELAEFAS